MNINNAAINILVQTSKILSILYLDVVASMETETINWAEAAVSEVQVLLKV